MQDVTRHKPKLFFTPPVKVLLAIASEQDIVAVAAK